MSVRLTIKMRGETGAADKAKVVVLNDDVIVFGRGQQCQVQLAQHEVSREHARISRDDTLFFVEDLNSVHGTSINGTKLPKGEKRLLRNGDTILIAQFDVTFDRVAEVEEGEERTGHTRFISANVVRDVMHGLANTEPYLRVMNGPLEGHKINVAAAQEYIVGRDETADIQLQDDLVSRRHVKIRRDWSGTSIEDLGSRNGIKVNKKKTKHATLKDRDTIQIGNVKLLFIDPSEPRDAPLVMPAEDEHESTVAVSEPDPEPEQRARPAAPPPDDGANETREAPEPNPDEASNSQANPDDANATGVDENGPEDDGANEHENADDDAANAESQGDSDDEAQDDAPSGPMLDFSKKQTFIVVGVVALFVIIALAILTLLFVGA